MKKILAVLLLISVLLPAVASAEYYLLFANVIDLEYDTDCVVADDGCGNLWEFYGVDHFYVADLIAMMMDDNETPDWVYDDHVVKAYPTTAEEASELVQSCREAMRSKMSPSWWDGLRSIFGGL